jgi:hypothetical protein
MRSSEVRVEILQSSMPADVYQMEDSPVFAQTRSP